MGSGGHGQVYQYGVDEVVKSGCLQADDGFCGNLLKEYFIVRHIDHPNIVKFNGIKLYKKTINIAMPRYERTLAAFIRDETVGAAVFDAIFLQLLSALRELHRHRILHMDIKASNIMMDGNTPILIDFSSAICVGSPTRDYLSAYSNASPEVMDRAAVGPASDLYMLALVMKKISDAEDLDGSAMVQWVAPLLATVPELRPTLTDILGLDLRPPSPNMWINIDANVEPLTIAHLDRYLVPEFCEEKKEAGVRKVGKKGTAAQREEKKGTTAQQAERRVTLEDVRRLAASFVASSTAASFVASNTAAPPVMVAALVLAQEIYDAFYYEPELLIAMAGEMDLVGEVWALINKATICPPTDAEPSESMDVDMPGSPAGAMPR